LQNCRFWFPLYETWERDITVYSRFVESIFTYKLYMKIPAIHTSTIIFLYINILMEKFKFHQCKCDVKMSWPRTTILYLSWTIVWL
jgi:hypothetical protein